MPKHFYLFKKKIPSSQKPFFFCTKIKHEKNTDTHNNNKKTNSTIFYDNEANDNYFGKFCRAIRLDIHT